MLKIRLRRMGAKKAPFYRIVVAAPPEHAVLAVQFALRGSRYRYEQNT